MPRASSKSTKSVEVSSTSPINTPTPSPQINIELSTTTPVKRTKKTKEVQPEVDVTLTTIIPETPIVEENVIVDQLVDVDQNLTEQSAAFFTKLQSLGVLISSIKSDYRSLEKKWSRDLKTAQKKNAKGRRGASKANGGQVRAPSGFVKPTRISDELASFLGKEKGTEMARTAVTKDINAYIRSNNLQDIANGRKINPDTKLSSLLKLSKDDELTYFNLQKYMSPHFYKKSDLVVENSAFSV